ncbi:MAG: hypothetical protein IT307_16195, partial [Chloroflexi bacterium]|nr:hypothetical protein [Chloroflexota bacterium]
PGLGPGAFGLARLSGLLLVSYLAWLAASLKMAPFGQTSLGAFLAMLLASTALLVTRRRLAFRSHLKRSWRFIAAAEAVFTVVFAIGVVLRMANPDLWHPSYGGEKPMDFAFLNAVVKSDYFPPYDPWFAGGSINYYYFGFVLVAALVKLTGIVPSVAYNLAIALWLAMTAQVAFTLAYCLYARGRWRQARVSRQALLAGVLAALFVCLIGNLDGALQLRDALWKSASFKLESAVPLLGGLVRAVAGVPAALRNGNLAEFDFWRSTRVIGPEDPGPITEFPFFTVLYGDLHAHLLALPLTILAVCLALELLRARALPRLAATPRLLAQVPLRWEAARVVLVSLFLATVVGALRATNTWDFPTYLLIGGVALGIAQRPLRLAGLLPRLLLAGGLAVFVFGASSVLFGLYLDRYQLGYTGVEPVKAHTNMVQFLTINGFWLFILASWVAVELTRRASDRFGVRLPTRAGYFGGLAMPAPVEWSLESRWGGPALGVALVALVLAAAGYATLALLLVLGAALLGLALLRWQSGESLFTIGLAGLALAVMAVPEVVNLQGDIGRMNTVFKFYYQAWTLLAVTSACLVVRLTLGPLARWMGSPGWRRAWLAGLALLSAAVLVYPLRAPAVKLPLRFTPLAPTLDGMAFMERATYRDKDKDLSLDADYRAIRWLQDTVVGTPVILEAQTGLYKWGSRVSVYTGLPTVLGWDWHEKQQRVTMGERVDERLRDVKTIYESPRMDQALPLLKKYDVSYIYVGPLERAYYAAAGLKKLEEAPLDVVKPVYQANQVTIYQVVAQ